jgi:hypothetical protein
MVSIIARPIPEAISLLLPEKMGVGLHKLCSGNTAGDPYLTPIDLGTILGFWQVNA